MKRMIFIGIIGLMIVLASVASATDMTAVDRIIQKLTPQRSVSDTDALPQITFYINFELGSAQIRPDSIHHLENLCNAIRMSVLTEWMLSIEGHTCDLGEAAYNQQLSRRRANAARDYLVDACGLPAGQFRIRAWGENQPLVPNISEQNRRRNRRVVVKNTLNRFEGKHSGRHGVVAYLQMTYLRDDRIHVFQNDTVLTPKDGYAIAFKFKDARYVYIGQIDSANELSSIFPNPEYLPIGNPVKAHQFVRVPPYDKWFELDRTEGWENVILLASKTAIQNPERAIRNNFQDVRSSGGDDGLLVWKRRFAHRQDDIATQKNVGQTNAADIAAWVNQGIQWFDGKQYAKAILAFEAVLNRQPDHRAARQHLFRAYLEETRRVYTEAQFDQVLNLIERCHAKYPQCREYQKPPKVEMLTHAVSFYRDAFQKHLQKELLEKQIRALNLLLAIDPALADALRRRRDAQRMLEGFVSP